MSERLTGIPVLAAKKPLGGISTPTLYDLINSGKLKTYKIGRKRYTTEVYISECIRTLTQQAFSGGRKVAKGGR